MHFLNILVMTINLDCLLFEESILELAPVPSASEEQSESTKSGPYGSEEISDFIHKEQHSLVNMQDENAEQQMEIDDIVVPSQIATLEVAVGPSEDDEFNAAVAEPEENRSAIESEESLEASNLILRSIHPELHEKIRSFIDVVVPKNGQGVHRRGGVLDQLIGEWIEAYAEQILF